MISCPNCGSEDVDVDPSGEYEWECQDCGQVWDGRECVGLEPEDEDEPPPDYGPFAGVVIREEWE